MGEEYSHNEEVSVIYRGFEWPKLEVVLLITTV